MSEEVPIESEEASVEAEAPADEVDAYRMSLLDHLVELRSCVIRSGLAVIVCVAVAMPFGEQIFTWLMAPAAGQFPEGGGFTTLDVTERFMVWLKCSLFAGLFGASPVVFHQLWSFIAPGLYRQEKRLVMPFVLCATTLFIGGGAFCYYQLMPYAMHFFLSMGMADDALTMVSMSRYLSFSTRLIIIFGGVFELPLIIFFLARLGVVSASGLARFRRYAIICLFVGAALVTPPDPITQLMLALPLVVLYEVGIVTARVWGKAPESGTDSG
ncbi:MAG TPA: twin-arginine translocase subunit TatC [Deltaproteobacteria bacterium]|nr:twin-arginine translocase subunit TatC [Deltaproteobacteria bacterium]HCP46724.1 twin-arginine translocase subunit TatC [Deltaproteobacteria bacterium]